MKHTLHTFIIATSISFFGVFQVQAQENHADHDHDHAEHKDPNHDHSLCLSTFTKEEEKGLNANHDRMKKAQFRLDSDQKTVLIPVTYHLIRRSDGTGGITKEQVDNAMDRVNGIYNQFGMHFYQCGPELIHNTDDLYTYDREGAAGEAIAGLDVDNTYNMYFSNNVNGACGFAFFPGGSPDRTVLANGCVTSGTTLEHEIGHSFGLRHTHGGDENVARPGEGNANCTTAGDRLCDTEADPTLSGTSQDNGTCELSNLGNGPDGLPYRTDGTNIMSYAPRKNCRTVFSQEQMDLMYFTASTHSDRTKFTCSTGPLAKFDAVTSRVICVGDEIQLEDLSEGDNPFNWNWTFDGGTTPDNTVENPIVSYNSTGTYAVSLSVSNDKGSNTKTEAEFIKVINSFSIPYEQDFSDGISVLDDFGVVTNSESRIDVSTRSGRTDNGLQLTGDNAEIYYVKAKKERAFQNNPAYNSSVTIPCLDATDFENLELKFDLKLLYSGNRNYTTFRFLVNGEQFGETYNLTSDNQEDWNTITADLSAYAGSKVNITFQANTRSSNSNSVYIDNISLTGLASNNLKPQISTQDETLFCSGESSLLEASVEGAGSFSYQWKKNNQDIQGATSSTYTATESGSYTVYVTDGDQEGQSSAFSLNVINKPASPIVTVTPSCGEGTVTMTTEAEGIKINWYESMTSSNVLFTGETYEPTLSNSTNFYVEPITQGIAGKLGANSNEIGDGGIHVGDSYLILDVFKPILIKSATVYAEEAKNRTLELRNSSDELIESKVIFIESGESVIDIDLTIPTGNDYQIGFTDGADLYRNNDGTNYPYGLAGLASIKASSAANNPFSFYYYLYDLDVQEVFPVCIGDRIEVQANVIAKPIAPLTSDLVVCNDISGPFMLEATPSNNGELRWYASSAPTEVITTGTTLNIPEETTTSETYYVEEVSTETTLEFGGPKDNAFGTGGFHAGGFYLVFDVTKEVLLKSALVYADGAKDRTLELRNSDGDLLESKTIFIADGESRIDIDLLLAPGSGLQIGFATGADLFRNNEEVPFPFSIGSAISINASTANSDPVGFYYYLYDWEIESTNSECASDKSEVLFTVTTCVGLDESLEQSAFSLYPNPTNGIIEIDYEVEATEIKILNSLGEVLLNTKDQIHTFDFNNFAPGVYYFSAIFNGKQVSKKIVVE